MVLRNSFAEYPLVYEPNKSEGIGRELSTNPSKKSDIISDTLQLGEGYDAISSNGSDVWAF